MHRTCGMMWGTSIEALALPRGQSPSSPPDGDTLASTRTLLPSGRRPSMSFIYLLMHGGRNLWRKSCIVHANGEIIPVKFPALSKSFQHASHNLRFLHSYSNGAFVSVLFLSSTSHNLPFLGLRNGPISLHSSFPRIQLPSISFSFYSLNLIL